MLNARPIRKCGENPRSVNQVPVLGIRDLRFCYQKSGCARKFPIFPRAYNSGDKNPLPQSENATTSSSRGNIKGPLPETKQRPFFVSA